ncbi:ubiquinol-cytochrome C chaperone family protein [Methylobacterium aerolatum]|uniref:Cytochrome b pre-mRNA-processing protein 3 n=1 Tax=Methylobacterium aerolatum TaxID=418708 RepID=A0ABU0HXM9_9HYPH|nr:ubiquinol-cytochrome C chaperone family protein [Methylobacterium aerolatum]MDQ0446231.1 cytochrome b pre-mRNA-processing protein 3 [Methylobacterium aerolatum]GJD35574.1 hypothetical protein FMGBMHLM_2486 [Methylobacterium aerolatum]
MWGFFRRGGARRRLIVGLHGAISDAARHPALYTGLHVPDTVEGRFESLSLHVYLVLRRLDRLPPPAADVAQELVDSIFAELDASLRELGVSDMGVGKRMKKLGASFYGRVSGYDEAMKAQAGGDAALRHALARNILGAAGAGEEDLAAAPLARYVRAAEAALARADLDALLTAGPPFPDPGAFAGAPLTEDRPA